MKSLAQQQCLLHGSREAAARCPECKQFFCRECITEHDDRIICAGCLKKSLATNSEKKRDFEKAGQIAFVVFGLFTAWIFFYWLGEFLISIPADVHEGTIWHTGLLEE